MKPPLLHYTTQSTTLIILSLSYPPYPQVPTRTNTESKPNATINFVARNNTGSL